MTEPRSIDLTPDGQRALREAENLCWHTNVAILAPEHLLGGALVVLAASGHDGMPPAETIKAAVASMQGSGSERLTDNVMWGSAARMALNSAAGAVRVRSMFDLTAARIALGVIDSDEVSPMTYLALGQTRAELRAAIAAIDSASEAG